MSAITDQSAVQEVGGNTGDIDDDEGGGLVSNIFLKEISFNLLKFYQIIHISVLIRNYTWRSPKAL